MSATLNLKCWSCDRSWHERHTTEGEYAQLMGYIRTLRCECGAGEASIHVAGINDLQKIAA